MQWSVQNKIRKQEFVCGGVRDVKTIHLHGGCFIERAANKIPAAEPVETPRGRRRGSPADVRDRDEGPDHGRLGTIAPWWPIKPRSRMDVRRGSGATHSYPKNRKYIVNVNVLKHRMSRMNAALTAMGEPGVDCPPVVRAYVTGVRDALAGVLADTPEDQA